VVVYLPGEPEYLPGPRDDRRLRLAKLLAARQIAFIDLTPDLRAVSPDSLDWLFITPHALPTNGAGGHYTAVGHRWVAAHLAAHLRTLPAATPVLTTASR
jgi:hypothetical protein